MRRKHQPGGGGCGNSDARQRRRQNEGFVKTKGPINLKNENCPKPMRQKRFKIYKTKSDISKRKETNEKSTITAEIFKAYLSH